MTMVSLERLRNSPNPVGTALATIAGISLLIIGMSWIAVDRSLLVFEIACIIVGLFALPPVSRWMRDNSGMGAGSHWLAGLAVMAAATAWTIGGPSANSMNERFADNPVPALIASADAMTASDVAGAAQEKAAYLQNIAAAQSELGAIDPASFAGGHDAVMAGLSTLSAWRAMSAQAASYTLSPEEQAQVDAFAKASDKQRAALMPALRRAYADSLRTALSGFGVTAETSGEKAQSIQIVGYALNDQGVLNRVRALLTSDISALGFADAAFVPEKGGAQAPVATPAAATAADATTAVTPTAAPGPVAAIATASPTL